ncbi:MAG: diacylglycerol kinase family protein [Paludibacteraceae bacterium]
MTEEKKKWAVIANPKSGTRRYFRRRVSVEDCLKDAGLDVDFVFSEYPGHAGVLAKDFIENKGVRHIIVVGGDGTVSEVIHGIFSSSVDPREILFAVIPAGTGNDWSRYWGIKRSLKRSIAVIQKGNTRFIDVGKLVFHKKREPIEKYFINSVGIGYDAQVVQYAETIGHFLHGRSWVYSFAVIAGAVMHSSKKLRLEADGGRYSFEDKVYSMSIANGPYTGGGVKQTPQASPLDGKFDIMAVVRPSFFHLIAALYRLFRTNLQEESCVKYFRAEKLTITTTKRHKVEADGILLHEAKGPYELTILPRSIKMIVP